MESTLTSVSSNRDVPGAGRRPPVSARRAVPGGRLRESASLPATSDTLLGVMRRCGYSPCDVALVKRADSKAGDCHKGRFRKTRSKGRRVPEIEHSRMAAIRAALLRYSVEGLCGALLHDTFEATLVTGRKEIHETFSGCALPSSSASSNFPFEYKSIEGFSDAVFDFVSLLSKPKLSGSGEWIFPDNEVYFSMTDHSDDSTYDLRNRLYYERLFASNNVRTICFKLVDNTGNLETMEGLEPPDRQRALRAMAPWTIERARIFLAPDDVEYIKERFAEHGFVPPETMDRRPSPEEGLVFMPPRGLFTSDDWGLHPDPQEIYVSIYGNQLTALSDGYIEVGFPPNLRLDYIKLLSRALGPDFRALPVRSRVPPSSPLHEKMFRISDFGVDSMSEGFPDGPRCSLRPSRRKEGFISVVDSSGDTILSLSAKNVSSLKDVVLGEHLSRIFRKVEETYLSVISKIREVFNDHISSCVSTPPEPH